MMSADHRNHHRCDVGVLGHGHDARQVLLWKIEIHLYLFFGSSTIDDDNADDDDCDGDSGGDDN